MSTEKRATEAKTSPHKENVVGVLLASEYTVPSPDRSRFELPAAIEGLRQMVKTQGEVLTKLAEKVEKMQVKPVKALQQRQQKTPPRQEPQLEQEQQPMRTDSQDQLLIGTGENGRRSREIK